MLSDSYASDIYDLIIFIYRDEYYNGEYVTNGKYGGPTYIPEYYKSLSKVDVKLFVAKNRNTCKCETAHLFYNRSNGNYFE